MISHNELKLGDVIYQVYTRNNIVNNKKIIHVDSDGIEWYRYEKPRIEHIIQELVYCGKVTFQVTGEVDPHEDHETKYYFKYPNGEKYIHYESDIEFNDWFKTENEAKKFIEELKKED